MASQKAPALQRRRRRQRWVLTALGMVFAGSAVLRLGALDLAFAQDLASPAIMASAQPDMTQTLQGAIQEIDRLRRDLAEREAILADRERAIGAAQALLEQRLADLEASEARLAALIATSDQAAESDLDRLTRVYETMPPAEVAAIFAQMQPSFAAGFLTRMSPAASANLMAAMTPQQAYAVSVVIATRNSSAPRFDPGTEARSETEN